LPQSMLVDWGNAWGDGEVEVINAVTVR